MVRGLRDGNAGFAVRLVRPDHISGNESPVGRLTFLPAAG